MVRPLSDVSCRRWTHVGISLRRLQLSRPIEHPNLNTTETPLHRRYDRVLLSYRDDVSDDLVRKARQHLTYLSERTLSDLSKSEELDVATVATRNKLLLQAALHDPSIQLVLVSCYRFNHENASECIP